MSVSINNKSAGIYLKQIYAVLPRLLASFDVDPTSPMRGCADRLRWAWKLSDFANGTPQSAALGLAVLVHTDMLPDFLPESRAVERISLCFEGARAIMRRDGSWEEAFPYEGSFCVTALVAYGLLGAIEFAGDRLDREKCLEIVRPGIDFLKKNDESHAFISNHLATAAAALIKWSKITGESGYEHGAALVKRILQHQSAEGWFEEYGGADPGYQSLCCSYLADIDRMAPELLIASAMKRAFHFSSYAVHPDGSFGGWYGSRNTRFWYPFGGEYLSGNDSICAAMSERLCNSISDYRTVTLETMDVGNLAPMFNSYCLSAAWRNEHENIASTELPCEKHADSWREFPHAGLVFVSTPEVYAAVSLKKGGVIQYYPRGGTPAVVDAGIAGRYGDRWFSTQSKTVRCMSDNARKEIVVESVFCEMHREWPSPVQMIMLRLMGLSVMRIRKVSDFIKRLLVRRLITGVKTLPCGNVRTIRFAPAIEIEDRFVGKKIKFTDLTRRVAFSAIHMASCGYWQRQDT